MKGFIRRFGLTLLLTLAVLSVNITNSYAQCAMCTMSAEQSVQNGNTQGKGLNKGILFLLAMPYLAVGAIGYLWYKKYRRKRASINFEQDPINLN
ncbi:hypothetical protein H8S90_07215 [Olivibacter sp. SDN3]|uniref:hypothetical protein n=1 Tax=Olivibacter sp. SDN3 TaxID=2764720 RepID=UPI001651893C|nr:hypothetical protein [Olivibacter sp. SDN3]QNL51358.1 hypothetical protein H8S90_07215 [Olivibacter sp. SDN3]